MFNVTILRRKDLIRYLMTLVLLIIVVFVMSNLKGKFLKKCKDLFYSIPKANMANCLEENISLIGNLNERNVEKDISNNKFSKKNILQGLLETQISSIKVIEDEKKQEAIETSFDNLNEKKEKNDETKKEDVEVIETNAKTEVITVNPISENFNRSFGKVKIKNETQINLTDEMLNPNIKIENKNILLFHTHTCESYTSSKKYTYSPTGNFRTTDLNFSVVKVGDELEKYLKEYNYNVIHNRNYHDYPAYNGSYTRSLATVQNILKTNPSDIIVDLHRDAIGSRSDYAPIVKIGEEDIAAQIMFVIGTNEGGLYHPNWNQNLKFAVKVQEKAEEMYPGLFKPITLTSSRYNQHTGKYASIIEVGATGNTLEQCLTSMKYLSKVLDEILK